MKRVGLRVGWPRRRSRAPFHCDEQDDPGWDERAEDSVRVWLDSSVARTERSDRGQRIADFGAGNERLRAILHRHGVRSFQYVAFDLRPQRESVLQVDLDNRVPAGFDVAFCLGVVEYLHSPQRFVERMRTACRVAVVSYAALDFVPGFTIGARRRWGWTSHYTRDEFEAMFVGAGWELVASSRTVGGQQGLWVWTM